MFGYYYLAKSFSGELKLGGPELIRNSNENSYKLEWVDKNIIPEINLLPPEIKEKIIKEFN